ncbi:MAG TPA: response regulator transcription factor [Dehalococcoidia bacterium]|nr:response regulator transcription factor [Dehalococcoidia bacterium]
MEPVKVLVVDDHALFRRGIVTVLANQENINVVGEAVNGLEAIEKTEELKPDVIVMDLNMPHCSGLEATQALQARLPRVNILVLTVSDNEADLFAAIKFGATGYILKNTEPEELVQAIHHIAQGGVIISPVMASKLLTEFRNSSNDTKVKKSADEEATLSPREDEVLRLVAQGATNKEIADSLFISENTVKTHLRNIMDKLHLANRSQAAAYAVKRGLVPSSDK